MCLSDSDAGLAGKTDVDQARADMIVDCFHDILTPIATANWATEEEKKVLCRIYNYVFS